jgi:tripartite ATP-independent transporter DctM subunit
LIIFLLFMILLLFGVPIVFALLVPCLGTFVFYPQLPIQLIDARLANTYFSSSVMAIPMFIFAAQILTDIKVADSIFAFVNKLVGHVRGGLAHVNVLASIIFAGMSGSTSADAAGLGRVEIKAMKDQGYPLAYSAAVTAASSTIGPIIPPSIAAIFYGTFAQVSITKLLIGGFIPGLVMAICLMVQITLTAKYRGFPKTKFAGIKEIWKSFKTGFPGLLIPIILIGGILSGFFTPTEAAAVAVFYGIILGFCLKTLNLKGLWQALKKSALDTAVMMIAFFAASLVGLIVTRLQIGEAAVNYMSGLTTSPWVLLLLLNIFLLIVGCLLDPICSLILFTPILVPLVTGYGIDPIHFGIIMVLNLMIGNLTPPMGGLLFITCKVAGVKLVDLLKEIWPLIIWLVGALLIVTYEPQTVLWLPKLIMK